MVPEYEHDLKDQAEAAGGRVTLILGNHEIMNLSGQFTYVHTEDMKKCGGPEGRMALMTPPGFVHNLLSQWKLAHVENRTLFCHAGVHTSIASSISDISDLEVVTVDAHPLLLEHRQYMADDGSTADKNELRQMLDRLGCSTMVIGHNPVDKPGRTWNDMVMRSDSMMSRAFGASNTGHAICIRPSGFLKVVNIPFGPDLL